MMGVGLVLGMSSHSVISLSKCEQLGTTAGIGRLLCGFPYSRSRLPIPCQLRGLHHEPCSRRPHRRASSIIPPRQSHKSVWRTASSTRCRTRLHCVPAGFAGPPPPDPGWDSGPRCSAGSRFKVVRVRLRPGGPHGP